MKSGALVSLLFIMLTLSACGSQSSNPAVKIQTELFKLAQMNGCIECHRVDATVVGPSWKAIAERYKDAPKAEVRSMLIESTKKGSVGKWATWKGGNGMPAMEKRVASATIEKLIDYILTIEITSH